MTIYFYDSTEVPGLSPDELVTLVSKSGFGVNLENVIQEQMDRSVPALLRPELARLVCIENAGQTVVCSELDRLGQDAPDILKTVAQMRSCQVKLFCLQISDSIDLASRRGEIILATIKAYAKLLTTVQGSRVRKGQTTSKNRGNKLGRQVELTDAQDKQILKLVSEGKKVSEVAAILGLNRWAVNRAINRASSSLPSAGLGVSG
jgi:DNA invertase Pin-like site-specific DNA recombinase